ncbi:Protein SSUH2 -like protein [Halotydeus destructor]|nr:Protein SSUH2 -like protein [Halotydeus destructor]
MATVSQTYVHHPPLLSSDATVPKTTMEYELPATQITESQVRIALRKFAKKKPFFTNKQVSAMTITDIENENVFDYRLTTMYEKRTTIDVAVPYYGEELDGPENGPPPMPWDIPVHPAEQFAGGEAHSEVPHTAHTKLCYECRGIGHTCCNRCAGQGHVSSRNDLRTCIWCQGSGAISCHTCRGRRHLKHFVQLVVVWKIETLEHFDNPTGLSESTLKAARGYTVIDQISQQACDLDGFPLAPVRDALSDLIEISLNRFPAERAIRQKLRLELYPVANVIFRYGKNVDYFRVYGLERTIAFSRLPSTCSLM